MIKVFIFTIAISACSKSVEHRSTPQGGQDSGGGNTTVSKISDVEFHYSKVESNLHEILSTFFSPTTIYYFKNDKKRKLLYEASDKITSLYTDKPDEYSYLRSGVKKLIESSKINIRRSSSCSSVDKVHASASIKEFKVGSTICLSFLELTKVPKNSLEREISSLLLHEYMHALGYDETHSQIIQNALINNYDRIFPNGTRDFNKKFRDDPRYSQHDGRGPLLNIYSPFIMYFNRGIGGLDRICKIHKNINIATAVFQKSDEQLLTRLSPQLINSNDITEAQIDEHLAHVEELRYRIYQRSIKLEEYCERNTELSPDDLNSIKLLGEDLHEFSETMKKANIYIKKYN